MKQYSYPHIAQTVASAALMNVLKAQHNHIKQQHNARMSHDT